MFSLATLIYIDQAKSTDKDVKLNKVSSIKGILQYYTLAVFIYLV